MATIALPWIQPSRVLEWTCPEAQGQEGQKVRKAREEALRHWNDRAEVFLEEMAESDDLSYLPVPLERAFTVRVKYRYVGEMKNPLHRLDE